MSDCPYAGRTWPHVRCKFEPRYDLASPDFSQFASIDRMPSSFVEQLRKKTYVRDVCVTCGKTIERSQP